MYRYSIARGLVDRPSPYKVGKQRVYDTDYDDMLGRVRFLHNQGYQRVTIQAESTFGGWYEVKTSRVSRFYEPA
jgi:hypothetical protein